MAIKPQILAAIILVFAASHAAAQQFGTVAGNQFPAAPGQMMQIAYSPGPVQIAPAEPYPVAYTQPQPAFGPMVPGSADGAPQFVASAANVIPSGPPPQPMLVASAIAPNGVAPNGMAPNGVPMGMDPANALNGQCGPMGTPPGVECGMAYPQGSAVPDGYPMMQQPGQGPAPYGPFAAPEPMTPKWYLRGEVVWLFRNSPNDRNLTSYNNASSTTDPLNNRFILDTDALPFGVAPGTRITAGRYLTDRVAIEGAFFGANNWDDRASTAAYPSVNGLGPLSAYWGTGGGPYNTSAFSNSNQQFATYHSSFDSAELGVRQWFLPSMSGLLGIRFLSVADEFQLTATNDGSNMNAGQVGYYRTWTNNNMMGVQCGTEYTHDLWLRWLFFSIEGKAGAFLNFADQKNLLFDSAGTYNQRSARETQYAGLGELTLAVTALVSNHLTLRGGYTFLFLDGVALASDQLDTNPTMANSRDFLADKGTMTLQGPFLGAELAW